ncbi:MAG: bifunctional phosphopantothenoylcysteine decarboxylase/phosphopantothenate--cysteine ligase CoaBC [bacterium]|nr:bifunctional phosphopantothenoylcysteine decarboxylase/phosphopantothenate--cysteine ligase CoaBC [bacterium]
MTKRLSGKKILLGVTGGIAAYKSVELLRLLQKEGAQVRVVMTANACEFVTPLTFRAISGHPVARDTFSPDTTSGIDHIQLTDWAELFLIAPATANIIGKMAAGIADDALSTMAIAYDGPFLLAPAMNSRMYKNTILQSNIERLKSLGYKFTGPDSGDLACGYKAVGRMDEPAAILKKAVSILVTGDLAGRSILVTAGPTRERIDPVRYISNRSSGKMGYAIAEEAAQRGAEVTLISGPTDIAAPAVSKFISVTTAEEMHKAVTINAGGKDALILSAAVADYRPESLAPEKIKKVEQDLNLKLTKTTDIASELGKIKGSSLLVGFAAETENLIENASKKLKSKGMDLIIANDVSVEGIGFDVDLNKVHIIDKEGEVGQTDKLPKREIAGIILDAIKGRLS